MSKKFWSFKKNPSPAIKVDKSELKKRLTPIQYRVTQEAATERPFSGEYLKLKDNGMYACVVCGDELFSSSCKYESGCGWPAFYDTEDENKLIYKPDLSHVGGNIILLALKPDLVRTEVTCSNCGAHLGHVFDDGPKPTGKRYCINSASLKFNRISSSEGVESECVKQATERITSLTAEAEKRQNDVINNTPDAADKSIGNTVILAPLAASKMDQQKAVRQSNSKPDPVIRGDCTSSSSTAPPPATFASPVSSVTHAEEEVNLKAAKRPASAILSERMRFFTSQRDASKYKADSRKNVIESPESRKAGGSRCCAGDANAAGHSAGAGDSDDVPSTIQACRPKNNFTLPPPLPPSTSSSGSKSSALRSSWFSPAASAKGS